MASKQPCIYLRMVQRYEAKEAHRDLGCMVRMIPSLPSGSTLAMLRWRNIQPDRTVSTEVNNALGPAAWVLLIRSLLSSARTSYVKVVRWAKSSQAPQAAFIRIVWILAAG